ncbi:YdgA family protein [Chitinilyticum piscinae]|uniref:YdgA family protein n=1 Tax=Chitinilyticum piscinae TaxID=2866724 RepID=A0A8J7K2I0_9NEIS|nr:YdgA family protein [Chitinilyticum piscinae]MBE9610057.1 YdgA family protein [Chitinilyticum piscinae]
MKRKLLIAAGSTAAALAIAYLGGSWYAGQSIQATMKKQHDWIASLPYFIVKNHSYTPGWFSSTESTTLQLDPGMYAFLIEREGQQLPKLEFTFINHIQHGPLPLLGRFNPTPYKAVVTTEIKYSPETEKLLKQFFGDKAPIEIENRIAFNDDGVMKIRIPDFDYSEAVSGFKAKWGGLDATLDYGGDFNRVKFEAAAPLLESQAKNVFEASLKDVKVVFDNSRGKTGVMLGTSSASVGAFDLKLLEGAPMQLRLEQLTYAGLIKENGDFIDATADIGLQKLVLDEQPYGPAILQTEATHLHGPTLAKVADSFTALQKKQLPREKFTEEVMKLAQTEGMPLLTHDPHLAIRKLEVKMPDGALRFAGGVGLKGFKPEDLNNGVQFFQRLEASADFAVPRKAAQTIAIWQFRAMLGSLNSEANQDDIDFLATQFVEGQIAKLTEQKLLLEDKGVLSAKATLSGGSFVLNGVRVPMPWQEGGQPQE